MKFPVLAGVVGGERSGRGPFEESQLPAAPQLVRGCGPAAWALFVAPACARAPLRLLFGCTAASRLLQGEGA